MAGRAPILILTMLLCGSCAFRGEDGPSADDGRPLGCEQTPESAACGDAAVEQVGELRGEFLSEVFGGENEATSDSQQMTSECEPGTSKCEGNQILSCINEGTRWETTQTCGEDQFCDASTCVDMPCQPSEVWCDETVLNVCSEDGKQIEHQENCGDGGYVCLENIGVCAPNVCGVPPACADDFTVAVCDDETMTLVLEPCPPSHFCYSGACALFLCYPGAKTCVDNHAMTCNESGSDFIEDVDCSGTEGVCLDGECREQ